MSDLNELHRGVTHDLGPNQLQWLRHNIPQFRAAEKAARAVREMVEENRQGMKAAHHD